MTHNSANEQWDDLINPGRKQSTLASKSPRCAYEYAEDVIKGRWPEAEKTISKDPHYAYRYAKYVIGGRWPEAEETISKSPEWAYHYASIVLNRRWPEAEETISKSPEWAYKYAYFVIKGRWPEAEETIIKDPIWAYEYAYFVIKGRWPEAEEAISTHFWDFMRGDIAYRYVSDVINGQRSAILELNFLCNTSRCKSSTVKEYVSKIDWTDPANDFPIPKRLKDALRRRCVAKQS